MTAGNDLPVALACHHERLLYFVTRHSAGDSAKDRNGSGPAIARHRKRSFTAEDR